MSSFRTLPVRAGGGSEEFNFPFKVFLRKNGDKWQRGVYYDSKLFRSFSYKDTQEIFGLLTETSPKTNDSGWADTNDKDYIWLDIKFTSGWPVIDEVSIKSKEKDTLSAWGGGEAEYTLINAALGVTKQSRARIVLAEISIEGDKPAIVKQRVSSNMYLQFCFMIGKNASGESGYYTPALYFTSL